jgi:hypothetical protein
MLVFFLIVFQKFRGSIFSIFYLFLFIFIHFYSVYYFLTAVFKEYDFYKIDWLVSLLSYFCIYQDILRNL